MNTRILSLHARSAIHCGTGQAIGGIDLPIAREKPTNVPLVPGSSIKGVLAALDNDRSDRPDNRHRSAFGPPTEDASAHAGGLQFGDARLAFLPVRSARGTFAWVTSPYLLRRLARDFSEVGLSLTLPQEPKTTECLVTAKTRLDVDGRVAFEDFDFTTTPNDALTKLAGVLAKKLLDENDAAFFEGRVCVVHDDVMSVLLLTCTEVNARIRLEPDTKTVAKGALWTEEALPVESILVGLVVATPVRSRSHDAKSLLSYLGELLNEQRGAIQVGGDASVGRGVCRVRLIGGGV